MDDFLKCTAIILVAVLVQPILAQNDKHFSIVIILCACSTVVITALRYFDPVMNFVEQLQSQSGIDLGIMRILMKITGIGLVAEISVLISSDSGNAAMGKAIGILASAVVLWLSVPLMQELLDLMSDILNLI